jgi:hypothetical protein
MADRILDPKKVEDRWSTKTYDAFQRHAVDADGNTVLPNEGTKVPFNPLGYTDTSRYGGDSTAKFHTAADAEAAGMAQADAEALDQDADGVTAATDKDDLNPDVGA